MSNKHIDFTQPAGFPLHQGVLNFMQTSYREAIKGLAGMAGNMTIVSGMKEEGNNVSAGWIVKDGEPIPFLAGAKQTTFIIEELISPARFRDGTDKYVFYTKTARFGSGVNQFAYADLKRISSNSFMLDAETFATSRALKRLAEMSLYESTVVIAGCEVSNINTVDQTCTISAGKVLLGDNYYLTPVYNGSFPAWINSSGAFVTADPGGLNVRFDPHTSQRKADVMRRAMHAPGDILMSKVYVDRFDPVTGVGKWEWLGFRLSEEMRGTSPVGYWFGPDGATHIYDPAYRTAMANGGAKSHQITKGELPDITLGTGIWRNSNDYVDGNAAANNIGTNQFPSNPAGPVTEVQTRALGSGLPFDMRTPYRVVLFIERI